MKLTHVRADECLVSFPTPCLNPSSFECDFAASLPYSFSLTETDLVLGLLWEKSLDEEPEHGL